MALSPMSRALLLFYLLPTPSGDHTAFDRNFSLGPLASYISCPGTVSISTSITVILLLVTEASIFHGRLAVLPCR